MSCRGRGKLTGSTRWEIRDRIRPLAGVLAPAFSLGVPLRLSAQMVEGPLFNPAGSRTLDALTYQAKGGSQRP